MFLRRVSRRYTPTRQLELRAHMKEACAYSSWPSGTPRTLPVGRTSSRRAEDAYELRKSGPWASTAGAGRVRLGQGEGNDVESVDIDEEIVVADLHRVVDLPRGLREHVLGSRTRWAPSLLPGLIRRVTSLGGRLGCTPGWRVAGNVARDERQRAGLECPALCIRVTLLMPRDGLWWLRPGHRRHRRPSCRTRRRASASRAGGSPRGGSRCCQGDVRSPPRRR